MTDAQRLQFQLACGAIISSVRENPAAMSLRVPEKMARRGLMLTESATIRQFGLSLRKEIQRWRGERADYVRECLTEAIA